jgi:dephospho-CoA kinase
MELPNKGNIVIIGYAATGKTTLTDSLKVANAQVWHTDDLINQFDFEEALYQLMPQIAKSTAKLKIIEGIQGYRLLRKGLQLKTFYADVVIVCQCKKEIRAERIAKRGKHVNRTFSLDKVCDKFWADYVDLLNKGKKKPLIIYHNTDETK